MGGKSNMFAKIKLKGILNIRLAVAFLIIVALLATYFFAYHLPMQRSRQWMAKGDAAMAEGKVDTAVYAYMRGSKEFPGLKGIHLALGKALLLDGSGDAAIEALDKELNLNEDSVEGHLLLGYLHLLSATTEDVYGDYLIDELPPLMGFPGMVGVRPQFTKTADYPLTEALYQFKYAEDLAPHELRAAYGLTALEGLQGDFNKFEQRLEEILERDPTNAFALDAISQVSYFSAMQSFGKGTGDSSSPGFFPGGSGSDSSKLPPLEGGWMEGEGGTETSPGVQPEINPEDDWGPPLSEGFGESGAGTGTGAESGTPGATVTPEGDVILRKNAFQREPRTRPIGPVISIPGRPPQPIVTVGNRFSSGQVSLSVGQTAEVPKSGIEVTLKGVDGNQVKLIEDGVEFTWVRGKVEWTWIPGEKKPTGEDTTDTENSEG